MSDTPQPDPHSVVMRELRAITRRQRRIETRLVRTMLHLGLDCDGNTTQAIDLGDFQPLAK